jgi:hypothetical protein
MSSPCFPEDVLLLIVSHLEDFPSLKSLSLVSKVLLQPSQSKLFHTIELRPEKRRGHALGVMLENTDQIAALVRNLYIYEPFTSDRQRPTLCKVLKACTALHSLFIETFNLCEPFVLPYCPRVREVNIECLIINSVDEFRILFSKMPLLTSLSISRLAIGVCLPVSGLLLPVRLRFLYIGLCISGVPFHLFTPFRLDQLTYLRVRANDIELLRHVLTTSHRSLTSLDLDAKREDFSSHIIGKSTFIVICLDPR